MPKKSLVFKAFSESKRLYEIGFDSWYGRVAKLAEDNNVNLLIHNKFTYSPKYNTVLSDPATGFYHTHNTFHFTVGDYTALTTAHYEASLL